MLLNLRGFAASTAAAYSFTIRVQNISHIAVFAIHSEADDRDSRKRLDVYLWIWPCRWQRLKVRCVDPLEHSVFVGVIAVIALT